MKFSDDQRAKIGGQASWPYSIPFFPQEVKMPRTHTLPLLLLALLLGLFLNEGAAAQTGCFADSGQALDDSYSFGVALGDLDGDGDLDEWSTNKGQPNRVWINQGGLQQGGLGDFGNSGQALGNSESLDVSLGDLDGDGDLDAWVANYDGHLNRVWINDGSGNFTDSSQALGNSDSTGVALGDLDGDGDLDAWVVNHNQPNRVWINDGLGNFVDSGQTLGNSYSFDVALGDIDGDGDLDAWVANEFNQPNHVYINQGGIQGGVAGNFADSNQTLGSFGSLGVSLDDVDGDGDLDAWVANGTNQANRVWINDGSGNFADSGQALGNSFSIDVALGDLDDDGDLDAWVANLNEPNLVWINDGLGNFADSSQALGNYYTWDVALGDIDGDGDLDAMVANWRDPNRLWINDCASVPPVPSMFVRGDANGDGDTDFWIGDSAFTIMSVWNGCPLPCDDAADANDDGIIDMADPGYLVGSNMGSSSTYPMLAPYPSCGTDPTVDSLACANPCPSFTGYNLDPDFLLKLVPPIGGGGNVGTVVDVEIELEIPATHEVAAYSYGICHDPAMLELVTMWNGANTAELVLPDPHPLGFNLHVIMDMASPFLQNYLQPGNNPVGVARFKVLAPGPTDIDFCSMMGASSPGPIALLTREISTPCNIEVVEPDTIGCTLVNTAPVPSQFVRGDTNASGGNPDIADAINVLNVVIGLPGGISPCDDASDVNDDGNVDLGDGIYLLLVYLFPGNSGSLPPPAPFPTCGIDPTPDNLDCLSFPPCP